MDLESAFNLLVNIARSQKLTWEEHKKVTEAIETVLEALNTGGEVETVTKHLDTKQEE